MDAMECIGYRDVDLVAGDGAGTGAFGLAAKELREQGQNAFLPAIVRSPCCDTRDVAAPDARNWCSPATITPSVQCASKPRHPSFSKSPSATPNTAASSSSSSSARGYMRSGASRPT